MQTQTAATQNGLENTGKMLQMGKPFVSIVVPGYNEAAIVEDNLSTVYDYMKSLEDEYDWELIFVNDGSTDETGELAEEFAGTKENIYVLNHRTNFRLGQALRFAFNNCRGDYIITLDIDLSYSPVHISKLLRKISSTRAKIVIASPYMKGGTVSHVPWMRRKLSIWANRYLTFAARGNLSTLTCMVRAYDTQFLRSVNLKSMDTEINEEIIYKAQLLGARILEIPANLDWISHNVPGAGRKSSMRIAKKTIATLFSGFLFRPFLFFILPGLIFMIVSLYPIMWACVHMVTFYQQLPPSNEPFMHKLSDAIAAAFLQSPHAFLVGGFTLMLSFQLICLGILALQNKRYFEEMFHLGTTIIKYSKEDD